MTSVRAIDSPRRDTLVRGERVGEYVVESVLADGGMSTVYAAIHPLIGKRVAIKVIAAALSDDARAVERFLLEARAVNQIRHPNIVDVFACGRLADGRCYLVMERLDGETLGRRLWDQRLTLDDACDILLQVCDALGAAHDQRIVHLDLKPDNVFLVPLRGGRTLVKLLDFGVAKRMTERRDATETEPAFAGTPEYVSPEQAQGVIALDGKSDTYSLGVMAFEIFHGRLPFPATEIPELLRCHIQKPPPSIDLAWAGSPPGLERLMLELLAKQPAQRPSMVEVHARLAEIREVAVRAPTRSSVASVRLRRPVRPLVPLLGIGLALLVGCWAHFYAPSGLASGAPAHGTCPHR